MTISKVYEQYSHLDGLLSDPTWLEAGDIKSHMLLDFWSAIKDHRQSIEKALMIAKGEAGPKLSGSYDEDARYNYPRRLKMIIAALEHREIEEDI